MASTANGLVVVTGGAGALGRAVLAEFRKGGAEGVALDLPGHPLDEGGREPGVHPVGGELSSREQVRAAWAQIDRIGTPTALVALAGGFRPSSLADLTEEIWDQMISSNVTSLLWCCQEAAPRIAAAGGGAVAAGGAKTAGGGAAARPGAT